MLKKDGNIQWHQVYFQKNYLYISNLCGFILFSKVRYVP